ncbi:MAG: Ppx/GppA phosphatase family protein [Peptoniphilaceae bacterium]
MTDTNRFGVIDIGSNTIRFNMYREQKKKYKVISSKKTFAGLSSYVEEDELSKAGIKKVIKILKKFKGIIEEFDLDETYIFATAAIRNVSNSKEVVEEIKEATGLDINVLSGELESYCDFLGASLEKDIEEGYIIDIGGGSTEIILINKGKYNDSVSIKEGSLSLFKKFVSEIIPSPQEVDSMRYYIANILNDYPIPVYKTNNFYGIGGTVRASGNIAQEVFEKDTNKHIYVTDAQNLIEKFVNRDSKTLHKALQVSPDRIHTQVPGMIILDEIMRRLNMGEVEICKNGAREGYIYLRREEM